MVVVVKAGRGFLLIGLLAFAENGCARPTSPSANEPARYTIPSCPLRYEVRTVEHDRFLDALRDRLGPGGLETFITLDATPRDAMTWELAGTVTAAPRVGKYRPFTEPNSSYARVRLTTDGRRIVEKDGPTALFHQVGTQGGLDLLFPLLPDSGSLGAATDWEVPSATTAALVATERARGRFAALDGGVPPIAPEAASPPLKAKVRFEGWSGTGTSRVARLTATASYGFGSDASATVGAPSARGTTALNATYNILASGRLLDAHLERTTHLELTGAGPQQSHEINQVTDAHLVAACDGPTTSSLAVPLSREERAIAANGDFIMAVVHGDRTKALSLLAPELRKAQGDEQLWSTLTRFSAARGAHALVPPVVVADKDVELIGDRVRIAAQGTTVMAATPNEQRTVSGTIELAEVEGGFRIVEIQLHLLSEQTPILQISRTSLAPRQP